MITTLEANKTWIEIGVFQGKTIRRASPAVQAAAPEGGRDTPALSIIHAAVQTVPTVHALSVFAQAWKGSESVDSTHTSTVS